MQCVARKLERFLLLYELCIAQPSLSIGVLPVSVDILVLPSGLRLIISVLLEQRIVVKFHMKLEKTASETYFLLKQVYGNECLSCARVLESFKRFQDGREYVEDDARSGRPSTSKKDENIDKIGNMIRSDRRLTIRTVAETVGIDKECVRKILHNNFHMQKVCAKMVPKSLTI